MTPPPNKPSSSASVSVEQEQSTSAISIWGDAAAPAPLAAMLDALACATPPESSRVLGRALEAISAVLESGPAMVAIVAWPADEPSQAGARRAFPLCTPLWETTQMAAPPREAARISFGRTFFTPSDGYIRAQRWRTLADDGTLLFAPPGVVDRLVGVIPVDRRAQIVLAFDRLRGQRSFVEHDRVTFVRALASIARVARDATLCRGIDEQLSPRERETLQRLLGGASEKIMADEMGITPASLHQLVVRVYRKLRVSSRSELMALFLAPPAVPAP